MDKQDNNGIYDDYVQKHNSILDDIKNSVKERNGEKATVNIPYSEHGIGDFNVTAWANMLKTGRGKLGKTGQFKHEEDEDEYKSKSNSFKNEYLRGERTPAGGYKPINNYFNEKIDETKTKIYDHQYDDVLREMIDKINSDDSIDQFALADDLNQYMIEMENKYADRTNPQGSLKDYDEALNDASMYALAEGLIAAINNEHQVLKKGVKPKSEETLPGDTTVHYAPLYGPEDFDSEEDYNLYAQKALPDRQKDVEKNQYLKDLFNKFPYPNQIKDKYYLLLNHGDTKEAEQFLKACEKWANDPNRQINL